MIVDLLKDMCCRCVIVVALGKDGLCFVYVRE